MGKRRLLALSSGALVQCAMIAGGGKVEPLLHLTLVCVVLCFQPGVDADLQDLTAVDAGWPTPSQASGTLLGDGFGGRTSAGLHGVGGAEEVLREQGAILAQDPVAYVHEIAEKERRMERQREEEVLGVIGETSESVKDSAKTGKTNDGEKGASKNTQKAKLGGNQQKIAATKTTNKTKQMKQKTKAKKQAKEAKRSKKAAKKKVKDEEKKKKSKKVVNKAKAKADKIRKEARKKARKVVKKAAKKANPKATPAAAQKVAKKIVKTAKKAAQKLKSKATKKANKAIKKVKMAVKKVKQKTVGKKAQNKQM